MDKTINQEKTIKKQEPTNVKCIICRCWGDRDWHDKISEGKYICHDCKNEKST